VKNSFRSLAASFDPRVLVALAACALPVWLGACSQTPVTVDLHSLQASGNVSFVCRADDKKDSAGHKLSECPDRQYGTRHLLGLVTQTATNEVAIVDLYAGAVVDVDPTTPGYSFLRVGARPGAIVSSPGGAASFVGVTGLQKNGIFALPTTCLAAPKAGEAARDLTSWSACALSSAPGDITVVVDPAVGGTTAGSCGGPKQGSADQAGRECPADLTRESGPEGRRKLVVALPDEHKLVLLDAQSLLDRPPGEFKQCIPERTFKLDRPLPAGGAMQVVPDELRPSGDACQVTQYPPPSSTQPTPGGFALSADRLYVADLTLSVVHVLDISDPCAAHELQALRPQSYLDPKRNVTTSRLAVSPLTPSGHQYVYAVDNTDQPTASVMVFDVSPLSAAHPNLTPLIFDGAQRQPYLPPDRLRFSAPVRDVSFVMRDFPASDANGVGQFGLTCDPDPNPAPPAGPTPGSQYRPNSDFTDGARPQNLRGLFAFAMLTNGQIAIIDVDDFDKPCRRPLFSNASSFEDFRGCASDERLDMSAPPTYYTTDGNPASAPTVTGESSCHVIEPHRPRSSSLSISSTTVGLRAPTLRSFPQFSNPDPSTVTTTDQQPRLLAVDFPNPDPSQKTPIPAQVNISAQQYANCTSNDQKPPPCDQAQQIPIDPRTAQQNSLVLPLSEPRSYAADESPVLTFEGRVFPDRTSGFLKAAPGSDGSQALLEDPDANFCAAGVEDSSSILSEAESLAVPAKGRAAWAKTHADYVQISGDFPVDDDVYWTRGAGAACSRQACENEFGNIDNPEVLSVSRDLSILEASGDHLLVTPRCLKDGARDPACDPTVMLKDIRCCFPAGTSYTVRVSHQWLLSAAAGLHDLAAGADGRCVHTASCDPLKKYFHSRAFEVCDQDKPGLTPGACDDDNVGCVVTGTHSATHIDATGNAQDVQVPNVPVEPGQAGQQCIFENLTSRFVVYRGANPSTRGMTFSWQTTGGFTPLVMTLATQSTQVNPQSISYLTDQGLLAVVDGSTLGLALFDLNSLGVLTPSPFF
jgi:hypothetical protein